MFIQQFNDSCSIFQTKILAIKKTAKMFRELCYSITGLGTIYVNNQAVPKAIKSSAIKPRVIIGCKKALLELCGSQHKSI